MTDTIVLLLLGGLLCAFIVFACVVSARKTEDQVNGEDEDTGLQNDVINGQHWE